MLFFVTTGAQKNVSTFVCNKVCISWCRSLTEQWVPKSLLKKWVAGEDFWTGGALVWICWSTPCASTSNCFLKGYEPRKFVINDRRLLGTRQAYQRCQGAILLQGPPSLQGDQLWGPPPAPQGGYGGPQHPLRGSQRPAPAPRTAMRNNVQGFLEEIGQEGNPPAWVAVVALLCNYYRVAVVSLLSLLYVSNISIYNLRVVQFSSFILLSGIDLSVSTYTR